VTVRSPATWIRRGILGGRRHPRLECCRSLAAWRTPSARAALVAMAYIDRGVEGKLSMRPVDRGFGEDRGERHHVFCPPRHHQDDLPEAVVPGHSVHVVDDVDPLGVPGRNASNFSVLMRSRFGRSGRACDARTITQSAKSSPLE